MQLTPLPTSGSQGKEKQLGTAGAAKDGGADQLCGTGIPVGYKKGLRFDFSLKPSFQLIEGQASWAAIYSHPINPVCESG